MTSKGSLRVPCLLLCMLCPFAMLATPVPVDNYSFEELNAALEYTPGFAVAGCNCAYGKYVGVKGWTSIITDPIGLTGIFQPGTNQDYFNSVSMPDGIRLGFVTDHASLSQVVGTVVVGTEYTLLVDVGFYNNLYNIHNDFDTIVQLLIGNTVITATGIQPLLGEFSTYRATFTGTPETQGQTITINLTTGLQQGDFDNVRFDATAHAPEPTTWGLLGVGLAVVTLARRKVKSRNN